MTTAVQLHETTKQFSLLGVPVWSQAALRSGKPGFAIEPHNLVAIDRVSFSIREGEIFGLVGPGGSGKTTLIRLIATLLQPDTGSIRVFGHDTTRQPAQVQRLINRVSVEASFFKQLSPLENLLFGMPTYGVDETDALWQVVEMLTRLGLEKSDIHTAMENLTRAKTQKVMVARALLSRPRLLLLDEPARGLDLRTRYEVWQIVRELRELHGTSVLLAVRDRREVDGLCDRIATLAGGRVIDLDNQPDVGQPEKGTTLCPPVAASLFSNRAGASLVCEEKVTF
jgi:ABC-2 type transport system ATP-binding protein